MDAVLELGSVERGFLMLQEHRPGYRAALRWHVALAWLAASCARTPPPRPSVLFIAIDTVRYDHVGCDGSARDTTPAIDALARDGVRFQGAHATAPWTSASVASMITGRYPSSHGLTEVATWLAPENVTLAEVLKQHGYETAAVVSNILLTSKAQFHQGYDVYLESDASHTEDGISTPSVTRKAKRLLSALAKDKRPFLLFVHYMDPHYDYRPHSEVGFAPRGAGRLTGKETIRELWNVMASLTTEEIDYIQAVYDEEIRFTDEGVGQLLATLRDLGLYDDTLIIVTADHGEEFLSHGWLGHTASLYEELLRVPLVIRPPHHRGGEAVVPGLVSLASLTPTVLDVLGIDATQLRLQAPSLMPLMAGAAAPAHELFSEVDYVPIRPTMRVPETHKKALVSGRHKIIRDDCTGRIEIYDLEADPVEWNDLAPTHPELVARLAKALQAQVAAVGTPPSQPGSSSFGSEEIEKLKALGYVGQ